jgi:heme A synthase
MTTIRRLALLTAAFAYALIVMCFVVRITDSGMGCGDHWPLCNGRLIPSFDDYQTVIEYFHRIAALGLTGLLLATAFVTFSKRREPGVAGPGGPLGPLVVAGGLLAAQVLLGAITVWIDLHASAVVLHLLTALAFLAALLITGFRAGPRVVVAPDALLRGIRAALLLSLVTILLGGLTATTGAAAACTGFPLCNGQLWPSSDHGGLAQLHWTHRLLAYGLFLHLVGLGFRSRRSRPAVRTAVLAALGVAAVQVVIAAGMVLMSLPSSLRGAHAMFGVGLWVALGWATWRARHAPAPPHGQAAPEP